MTPTTPSRTRRSVALAAGAAVLALLAACSHPTQRRTMAIAAVDGRPGFTPAVVTVDKENPIVITVRNTTNAVHGFSIEGYKVMREVPPGETDEVRFRASRGGTFRIYCQLHPAHQTATLVVR